jgi:hypothetical protein
VNELIVSIKCRDGETTSIHPILTTKELPTLGWGESKPLTPISTRVRVGERTIIANRYEIATFMSDPTPITRISPYGCELVDLTVVDEPLPDLLPRAKQLPSIHLSERALCDLELLATCAFHPIRSLHGTVRLAARSR